MDPKAALVQCDQAISDGDLDTAILCVQCYRDWRAGGGFEPIVYGKRGDVFASDCERRITDAAYIEG